MNVIISGICGHMGAEVAKAVMASEQACLVGGVDTMATGESLFGVVPARTFEELSCKGDVIIDFSNHLNTGALLDYAVSSNTPLVLATTGQTDEEKAAIRAASQRIPLFFAANYSIGVAVLVKLAKQAAKALPDAEIEIVEIHHDRKADAPSGTALALANAIKEVRPEATFNCGRSGMGKRTKDEIGISSIRMGNYAGEHEVMVGTQNETITLKHTAHSRAIFADGALSAAFFLQGRGAGLYSMEDMVD